MTDFTPRLVALDIDGTIVDELGRLPTDVREAVGKVVATDTPVVLSTGRSWAATKPVAEALDLPPGWSVCSNGAVVVSNPPFVMEHEVLFDPADSIEKVRARIPQARIAVERGLKRFASAEFPEGELQGEVHIVSFEELAAEPVSRLIIRDPNAEQHIFDELVHELGLHEVSYFVGWSAWLDIAPMGVDKAHGLEKVLEHYQVDRADVLAIGDGRNDIEMLEWAGRGVAMGQALDVVKAAADDVTATFDKRGVIAELERWF